MITDIYISNCFAFNEKVWFSLNADLRQKKLLSNVSVSNNFNCLKSAVLFGQNNAGKTCFINCVRSLKNIMLNKDPLLQPNLFSHSPICELAICFIHNDKKYKFHVKFDVTKHEFTYECFSSISYDKYSNMKEDILLCKDVENTNHNYADDEDLYKTIALLGNNNLIIYQLDNTKFDSLGNIKDVLQDIAKKIDVVSLNNIPMRKTIDILKNKNNNTDKIVDFIKNSDLYLNDYYYADIDSVEIKQNDKDLDSNEKVLNIPENIQDKVCLTSVYKNHHVPSFIFDSAGTKKLVALSSYIIEALEKGKFLFIDEIDSGIHFKLTRAIISMFNNEFNTEAQLICTAHDTNLMDTKRLLRKEQIWFVSKDIDRVYLYSLAEFTAKDGIRAETPIVERYKKGVFGSIPEPELIKSLLDIVNNKNETQE